MSVVSVGLRGWDKYRWRAPILSLRHARLEILSSSLQIACRGKTPEKAPLRRCFWSPPLAAAWPPVFIPSYRVFSPNATVKHLPNNGIAIPEFFFNCRERVISCLKLSDESLRRREAVSQAHLYMLLIIGPKALLNASMQASLRVQLTCIVYLTTEPTRTVVQYLPTSLDAVS